jgi:imidazolonepropionase-like amidohydrolase
MRIFRSHLPVASSLWLALAAPPLLADGNLTVGNLTAGNLAQEPQQQEPQAPGGAPPNRRQRRQTIVIEAGTVHPVNEPAIDNGVVVVRGERIVAIGRKGDVEVPENAVVRSFPNGHVYPGLIDAATDAFTDTALRTDGSLDAGSQLSDDLRWRGDREDELVQAGITTAYVTVRSPAQMRGQGAIVRPHAQGFEVWSGHEHASLAMRMTNGPGATHPLQRQQQLDGFGNLFDGLDEYRKAQTDFDEAVKKYQKEFDEYLAFHQKKKDGDKQKEGDKPSTAPAPTTAPTRAPGEGAPAGEGRPGRGPGGRRGGGPGGGPGGGGGGKLASRDEIETVLEELFPESELAPQDPPKQDPKPQTPAGTPAPQAPAGEKVPEKKDAEKKDEGPKRPTYPKAPPRDPAKDAMLRVLDGEIPLRIEAHRPDELRTALHLQQKSEIPLLVLEQAYGAAIVADDIVRQGASVVITEVLPNSMPELYASFDPAALPAQLQQKGVPFAIATGSARRAGLLPMMAATAIGRGLDREDALRAITLWPAQILGIAKDTGSLQAGKFADVMVCDRSLFTSDCRVLFVMSKGRNEFEAK